MNSLPKRSRRSLHVVQVGVALLVLGAITAQAVAMYLAEVNAGLSDYLVGESYWSKARSRVELSLWRYAESGDRRFLQEAQSAITVLVGDRDARLALEQEPADLETARRGLRLGMNPPQSIDRIVWMFRTFRDTPYFNEALDRWRASDEGVLELQRLIGAYAHTVTRPDAGPIAALHERLTANSEHLRLLQLEYLDALTRGIERLGQLLKWLSAAGFSLLALGSIAVLRQVTRRVLEPERRFRALFQQSSIGVASIDADGRMDLVNPELCRILGATEDALRGTAVTSHLGGAHAGMDLAEVERALATERGNGERGVFQFRRGDGAVVLCRLMVSTVAPGASRSPERIVLAEDVTDTHRLTRELEYAATHDALTDLLNRREMRLRVVQAVARARRDHLGHALLVLNLDKFSFINDSYGQWAGDYVLRHAAAVLAARIDTQHAVARLGDDEFCVLLENTTAGSAAALAKTLVTALQQERYALGSITLDLSASAGVVEFGDATPDTSWVFWAAHTACELAQEQGPGRVRIYVDSESDVTRRRTDVEMAGEIRAALAENRLFLFAQRIQPLGPAQRLQFEVLVRLMDSQGHLHTPADFITAAEKYGLIGAVDRHVIEQTLAALEQRQADLAHIELCHINISGHSISDPDFRRDLAQTIGHHRVPPGLLCFELTETAAISNMPAAVAFIDEMHALGCKIALDDFGSGMSSFGYLKSLAVDVLKIDGSFVRQCGDSAVDQGILGAITHVARILGKTTIAEWVEVPAACDVLQLLGVDAMQGYAIERPRPLDELLHAALTPALSPAAA